MNKNKMAPPIRFQGFTAPWRQRKLSEVTDRYDNLRVPVTANLRIPGNTPYYGANGIQDYVDGYTHDGEFILVAEDGAKDLSNYPINYVNGRIWVNNHAHVLQGKNHIASNKFLAYAMRKIDIKSVLVGGGRAKLNAEAMMKLGLQLPSYSEQAKIGQYFSNLDNLITLHQRKLEQQKKLKRYFLQNMFPAKGEKVPKIRFHGFTENWEQRKVLDVAERYDNLRVPVAANLRKAGSTPYYGANGIQDHVDGFTHNGEFILVAEDGANDLKNYPVNYVNGRIWVNNHAHVLQGKISEADTRFLGYSISQSNIESVLVGGGRAKLNADVLMNIELMMPEKSEQQKIGSFFASLEKTITLQQHKIDQLQDVKKFMLQNLFI